jgi:hypothetical protein
MLPNASWLMLSGGLALGTSGAALGLAAHSALLTAGLALLRPATLATAAAFGLAAAAPREAAAAPETAPPSPSIALGAQPVVSIGDGRPVAAVALEPSFRAATGEEIGVTAVDWQRIPPRLLARLDSTILARGVALACHLAGIGRRETVMLSVAAGSLADRTVLQLLAHAFQADDPARPPLLVLIRGGSDSSQAILGLPSSWHARVGLHLDRPLGDEPALRRCLELPLGCLEVEAGLLDGRTPGADLTGRLVSRTALGPVPVVVSGVTEERVARSLRSCPSLFARGSWFGRPTALAA